MRGHGELRAAEHQRFCGYSERGTTHFQERDGAQRHNTIDGERKSLSEGLVEHPPRVLCFNELKMGMLAKSCLCPGTNAFIFNLISSFREEDLMHREELGANSWTAEYRRGLAWELYKTKLPKGIEGRDFHWVVKTMYQRRGELLYALSIQKSKKAERSLIYVECEALLSLQGFTLYLRE